MWVDLNELILTGHENGECREYEVKVSVFIRFFEDIFMSHLSDLIKMDG